MDIDEKKVQEALNQILQHEMAGVVRYTHYALVVTGPNRIPIVGFMKKQATEALGHAHQVGEILTGLGGHPEMAVARIEETNDHSIRAILEESLAHEKAASQLYRRLLDLARDRSIYLEEFARSMISQEELHQMEIRKMLRDLP